MKTNKDELLHETLVRYYWRLGCNGAKALVDSVRLHPMVVVFGTIAIIYMYRFRDLSYVSDMGSVGHMIAITDTLAIRTRLTQSLWTRHTMRRPQHTAVCWNIFHLHRFSVLLARPIAVMALD